MECPYDDHVDGCTTRHLMTSEGKFPRCAVKGCKHTPMGGQVVKGAYTRCVDHLDDLPKKIPPRLMKGPFITKPRQ